MLHYIDREILESALKDLKFLRHYDAVMARFTSEMKSGAGWFYENIADPGVLPIAYFSAEYGLHHSLPFMPEASVFLAGDFLKESSDLGVPLIAVGFMYPEGYLRQRLSPDGWQGSESATLDRENAPIYRVLDDKGNRLTVKVPVIDPPIYVEVWKVRVGRVSLYLIDTNLEINDPWNRTISSHLYIGSIEQRLRQEIVLGIGGTEVLRALGIKHSALHLNEGHPAFAILERVRERIEGGMSYKDAIEQVRETTIFTTHTPVPAGHDVFPFSLMEKIFQFLLGGARAGPRHIFQPGNQPKDPDAGFNMTAFALKMSQYRNGVSGRHGEVARRMWQSLWPDTPEEQVPITHITNGVHVPTWIEPRAELLLTRYLGPGWLSGHDNPDIWKLVYDIPMKFYGRPTTGSR